MKKLILLSFLLLAFACDTSTKKKEKEIIVIPEPKEVVVEKKVEKIDKHFNHTQKRTLFWRLSSF